MSLFLKRLEGAGLQMIETRNGGFVGESAKQRRGLKVHTKTEKENVYSVAVHWKGDLVYLEGSQGKGDEKFPAESLLLGADEDVTLV